MKAILAMDENFGIGINGTIPWHLHMDMLQFEAYTRGKICFMGKTTYASLPEINRTRLKGRDKVIMSHKTTKMGFDRCQYWAKEYYEVGWFFERMSETPDYSDIILIGGKTMYDKFLPYCNEILLTTVRGDHNCDVCIDDDVMDDILGASSKFHDPKIIANISEGGYNYMIEKYTRINPLVVDEVPQELRPLFFPIKTYDWWSNRVK